MTPDTPTTPTSEETAAVLKDRAAALGLELPAEDTDYDQADDVGDDHAPAADAERLARSDDAR